MSSFAHHPHLPGNIGSAFTLRDLSLTSYRDPAHVLLVEDNPVDARVAIRTMQEWLTPSEVVHVEDGDLALEYLTNPAKKLPSLVLLDLNLRASSGLEVLSTVRALPSLRTLPVVILTTSQAEDDVRRSYELGANAYIRKPVDLEDWRKTLADVETFWFRRAMLPPGDKT